MNPEINIDAKRLLSLAHKAPTIARHKTRAISLPLERVAIIPATPTMKKKAARRFGSREYKNIYKERIAMIGQIIPTGATAPPFNRIPTPGTNPMTRDGLMSNVDRTITYSRNAISLR